MSQKVIRNTSFLFGIFVVVAGFAVSDIVPDDAGWAENFVAFSSAAAPWIVSAAIFSAAGEIIKAINERAAQPSRDDA